ncbi:MAG TPA: ABC transporter substrate-binding protein [Vicinamibacterales bacterium]|nr:ABC transporter substrate-binding protein [Vicinamibacterales bacterium]
MASRTQKLIALVAVALAVFFLGTPLAQSREGGAGPGRIVSLVPAITEMLFAIGAGPQVVAVSSYDEFPAEVKALPKVGALLDPDTERILALRPDLVVVYGSQSDLQTQLERAHLRTFSYRHGGIATTLGTIRDIGVATGHRKESSDLVSSLQARLDAVRDRVKGRTRPRVVLVFERQAGTLREVYASGGVGFLHEMLDVAGGTNVFADVARESVQPSIETLLARAPDVILEVRASGLIEKTGADDADAWSALSSVPAVKNRRVHLLRGDYLVVPGPRLAMATEAFARALHPETFK